MHPYARCLFGMVLFFIFLLWYHTRANGARWSSFPPGRVGNKLQRTWSKTTGKRESTAAPRVAAPNDPLWI